MLVNCVAYKQGLKLQEIEKKEINKFIEDPETLVWVALADPSNEEIAQMQKQFNLHHLAVEDILHGNQRPKLEEYNNNIFVSIHAFELVDGKYQMGEIYIYAGPNFVLSVRKNYKTSFADVRARCEAEPHNLSLGSGFILYTLIDAIVDRYFPLVELLEEDLETLEEQIFSQATPRKNIESLYLLKQKLLTLRHGTVALLEAVGKLHGGRVPAICVNVQDYFRDITDHLYRINLAMDTTREMLITAIQVNLTMISLEESRISKQLAAWAAILATPTMIAGIYGMNFKNMPELEWSWGYPVAVMVMVVVDVVLYFQFKKAKWL